MLLLTKVKKMAAVTVSLFALLILFTSCSRSLPDTNYPDTEKVNTSTASDVSTPTEALSDTEGNAPEADIVLPPVRYSDGEVHASLDKEYTFEATFEEADAVAHIRVGNWLYEREDQGSTCFEAEIIDCYKGDITGSFVLKQDGYSNGTLKGYPLFTHGNELLLFMRKSEDEGTGSICYWILGSFSTVLYASYDDSGNLYYLNPFKHFTEALDIPDYSGRSALSAEILNNDARSDKIHEGFSYSRVFSADDLKELFVDMEYVPFAED